MSYRPRLSGGVLIRVEMPTPQAAAQARTVVASAGFEVGGNDTPWETQLVFTVPAWVLDERYPGWRQRAAKSAGAGPSGPALSAPGQRALNSGNPPRTPHTR